MNGYKDERYKTSSVQLMSIQIRSDKVYKNVDLNHCSPVSACAPGVLSSSLTFTEHLVEIARSYPRR